MPWISLGDKLSWIDIAKNGTINNEYWLMRFFIGKASDIKFNKSNGKNGIRFEKKVKRFLFRKIYKIGKINNPKYSRLEILNNWRNNWLPTFINERKSTSKLGFIPNLSACLITLALSPPK